MGLDQYAGLRDSNGKVHIDFENVYSDKYDPTQHGFVWRKHARLQVFMNKQFKKQLSKDKHNTIDDLQHLGFNAGEGGVRITEEVIKELEEQIKNNYWDCFAHDGFFWGQQFQEEAVKEYKSFDKKFIKWAKEQLKQGRLIGYDCSW
jgi:hypothetical protein